MIHANELRLENWVRIDTIFTRVELIDQAGTYENWHPIPLTPEILEKCFIFLMVCIQVLFR